MVDSSDHLTGKTGLTPTVTLSKSGGAFASPAGAVSEIGNGWYKVAGNATDSGTLGPLLLHATASGADPCDDRFDVVAYDPQATSLGLSLAKTTNITGFNDIAATAVVSNGAITTSGGAVSNVTTTATATNLTNLPAVPTDWLTAAGVKADAVTKIQAGLSTYAGADTSGTTTLLSRLTATRAGYLDDLATITGVDGVTLATLQANYAPSKAGDAMALTTGERTSVGTAVWATTTRALTDKAGFALSATGLDAIAVTAPSGVAATFPAMVVQLWRRFFGKSTLTATQLKTYAADGTTVVTTQTVSDDGTTQTQGAAT